MQIVAGDRANQWRCVNEQTMLIGLITLIEPVLSNDVGFYKVEFLMHVEGRASTIEEAKAFANGCWAMAQALGRVNPMAGTHNQMHPKLHETQPRVVHREPRRK
jgi:hypothetical protein